ncbi:hypothetical protein BDR26DRAFT_857783 [Obelidium mucronatum]|nr:hypothetical protein BDR26DRAFT_857783 [Obelidium mucronatum]
MWPAKLSGIAGDVSVAWQCVLALTRLDVLSPSRQSANWESSNATIALFTDRTKVSDCESNVKSCWGSGLGCWNCNEYRNKPTFTV